MNATTFARPSLTRFNRSSNSLKFSADAGGGAEHPEFAAATEDFSDSGFDIDFSTLSCLQVNKMIISIQDIMSKARLSPAGYAYYNGKLAALQAIQSSKLCSGSSSTDSGSSSSGATPQNQSPATNPILALFTPGTGGAPASGSGGGAAGGGAGAADKAKKNWWWIVAAACIAVSAYQTNKQAA